MKQLSKRIMAIFLAVLMVAATLPLHAFVANAADTLSYQQEMFNLDFSKGTFTATATYTGIIESRKNNWGEFYNNSLGKRIRYADYQNYPNNNGGYLTMNNGCLYSDNFLQDFGAAQSGGQYLFQNSAYNQNYEIEMKYKFYDNTNITHDNAYALKLMSSDGSQYFGIKSQGQVVLNGTTLQGNTQAEVFDYSQAHILKLAYHDGVVTVSIDGRVFYCIELTNSSDKSLFAGGFARMECGAFTNLTRSGGNYKGMSIDMWYIKATSYQYRDNISNHLKGKYLTGTDAVRNRVSNSHHLQEAGSVAFDKNSNIKSAVFPGSQSAYYYLPESSMRALLSDCNENSGYTIAFYAKSNQANSSRFFDYTTGSAWNPDGASNSKYLYFAPNGNIKARTSSSYSTASASGVSGATEWHTWVITAQRSAFNVYRDGVQVYSYVVDSQLDAAYFADLLLNGRLLVGASCWGSDVGFSGNMRDLRIYDVAASASDATAIHTSIYQDRTNYVKDFPESMDEAETLAEEVLFYELFMKEIAKKGANATYADLYTNMGPAYTWYKNAKAFQAGQTVRDGNGNVLTEAQIIAGFKTAFNAMQPYNGGLTAEELANMENGCLIAPIAGKTFSGTTAETVIYDNNYDDNHKEEVRIFQPGGVLLYGEQTPQAKLPVIVGLSNKDDTKYTMGDVASWQYNSISLKSASKPGFSVREDWGGIAQTTDALAFPNDSLEVIPYGNASGASAWDSTGKLPANKIAQFGSYMTYAPAAEPEETLLTITDFEWDIQTTRYSRTLNTTINTVHPVFVLNHKKVTDALTGAIRTRGVQAALADMNSMAEGGMEATFEAFDAATNIDPLYGLKNYDTYTFTHGTEHVYNYADNYKYAAGVCADDMDNAFALLTHVQKADVTYIENALAAYEAKMDALTVNKDLYFNMAPAYASYLKAKAARDKLLYAGLTIAELNAFYDDAMVAADDLYQKTDEMTVWESTPAYSYYKKDNQFFPNDYSQLDYMEPELNFNYADYYNNVAFWNGDSIPDIVLTEDGLYPQSGDYSNTTGYYKDDKLAERKYTKFSLAEYKNKWHTTANSADAQNHGKNYSMAIDHPTTILINESKNSTPKMPVMATMTGYHIDGCFNLQSITIPGYRASEGSVLNDTAYAVMNNSLTQQARNDIEAARSACDLRINAVHLGMNAPAFNTNSSDSNQANAASMADYLDSVYMTTYDDFDNPSTTVTAAKQAKFDRMKAQTFDNTYFTFGGLNGDTKWHGADAVGDFGSMSSDPGSSNCPGNGNHGRFNFPYSMSRNSGDKYNSALSVDPQSVRSGMWCRGGVGLNLALGSGYDFFRNKSIRFWAHYWNLRADNMAYTGKEDQYLAGTSAGNVLVWNKNGDGTYDKNTYLYDVVPQWKTQVTATRDSSNQGGSKSSTYYTTRLGTNHIYVINFRPINDILDNHDETNTEEYTKYFEKFYAVVADINHYDNHNNDLYNYLNKWDDLIGFNLDNILGDPNSANRTTEENVQQRAQASADAIADKVDDFDTVNEGFTLREDTDVYDALRTELAQLTHHGAQDACYGNMNEDIENDLALAYGAMEVNFGAFGNDEEAQNYLANVFTGTYQNLTIAEIVKLVRNLNTTHTGANPNPAHTYLYAEEDITGTATFVCSKHLSHPFAESIDMDAYNELNMVYGTLDPDKYKGSRAVLNAAKADFDAVKTTETAAIPETQNKETVIQGQYVDAAVANLLETINNAADAQATQQENQYTVTYRLALMDADGTPITVETKENVAYGTALTMQADSYNAFPVGAKVYAWGVTVNGKENLFYKRSNTFTSYIQGDVTITAYASQEAQDENTVTVKIDSGWDGLIGSYALSRTASIQFKAKSGGVLSLILDVNGSTPKTVTLKDSPSNQLVSWKLGGFSAASMNGTYTVEQLLTMCGKSSLTISANVTRKLSADRYNIYFADQTVGSDAASSLGTITLKGLYDKQAHAQNEAQYDDTLTVTTGNLDFGANTEVWALALREKGRFVPVAYADDNHVATYRYLANRSMTFYVITRTEENGNIAYEAHDAVSGGKTVAITEKEIVHALEYRLPFSYSHAYQTATGKWTTYSAYTQNSGATVIECGTVYTNDPTLSTNMFTLDFVGTNNVYKKAASNPREIEKQYSYSFGYTTNCLTRGYVKYQYTYKNQPINAVSYANVCTLNFES